MVSFLKLLCSVRQKKWAMAQVCTTKLIFLYSSKLQCPGGYQDSVRKFQKIFFDLFRPRNNVVKVSSVNSELLFQWGHPSLLGWAELDAGAHIFADPSTSHHWGDLFLVAGWWAPPMAPQASLTTWMPSNCPITHCHPQVTEQLSLLIWPST